MLENSLNRYDDIVEKVADYYADLLILQYRNKPKARKTIKILYRKCGADGLVFQLEDVLDIDKALGNQLNLIGKIVGCPRTVQGINAQRQYFQFYQDEDSFGFSKIGKDSISIFRNIFDDTYSIYSLSDEDYRILIKFKIFINHLKASMKDMDEALWNIFGSKIIMNSESDLFITYIFSSDMMIAALAADKLGYFKAPLGISKSYIISVPTPYKIFRFETINKTFVNNIGFSSIGKCSEGTFLKIENNIYSKEKI